MEYKRLTEKVDSGFVSELDCRIAYNKLCAIEDKIENGELVDCIWFISWVSENVCCGQVIGYEEDSGFVILANNSMISADKIWSNRKDAEKELLERKIKELDEEEYQEFKAEAEQRFKELKDER